MWIRVQVQQYRQHIALKANISVRGTGSGKKRITSEDEMRSCEYLTSEHDPPQRFLHDTKTHGHNKEQKERESVSSGIKNCGIWTVATTRTVCLTN